MAMIAGMVELGSFFMISFSSTVISCDLSVLSVALARILALASWTLK